MAITNTSIDLIWTAATDNVGVVSYQIFRSEDNIVFTEIHESDGVTLAYTAIGLTPDTQYYFKQTAKDAAGNQSLYGNTVTASTLSGGALTINWDYTRLYAGAYDTPTLIEMFVTNENLDLYALPDQTDFTVKVNDIETPVTGISMYLDYVRLTVADFNFGDEIKVSYTAGTNPLKAIGTGNLVPNIIDVVLDNVLPEPAYTYLLDDYPGAVAAYSLQKLSSTVVQGIMVRRDSDDQLIDVQLYDDPSKSIDLDSIIAGGGAGTLGEWVGSASAFVFNWYDQTGKGNHASQFTEAYQPLIINSGVLIEANGKTGISFDGASQFMSRFLFELAPVEYQPIYEYTLFNTHSPSAVSDSGIAFAPGYTLFELRENQTNYSAPISVGIASSKMHSGVALFDSGVKIQTLNTGVITYDIDTQYLSTSIAIIDNLSNYTNNQLDQTMVLTTAAGDRSVGVINSSNTIGVRTRNGGQPDANYYNGVIQEIIFYPSDKGADRNVIEDNINSRYGMYLFTSEVDAQLIQADADNVSDTVIEINGVRSSASDTAVANLISRNVTVITS